MNHLINIAVYPVWEAIDETTSGTERDRLRKQWGQVEDMISQAGDGWLKVAAPFISCAHLALGDNVDVIHSGLISAQAGILLRTMIPSACSWIARIREDGNHPQPAGTALIMHGDPAQGTTSLWTRMGNDIITADQPDDEDRRNPAGNGKTTDSIRRELKQGHSRAEHTAAGTMLMLPALENIIPTDADLLLENTIWRSTSWYEHILHMLTALAEGMSQSHDLAHVRLHTALMTGGGWDPAFEQGVEDRTTPETAAAYDTGHDFTLWDADIINGLHADSRPEWPADADKARDLADKAYRIVREWNRFDPDARLINLQYPGVLTLNALRTTPEPAFEGEAHMLNTFIRMIRITPDHASDILEASLSHGDTSLLRLMLDQPDTPIGQAVALMVAASDRQEDTTTR